MSDDKSLGLQKESYADFSIIYKYCEQKKTNDAQMHKLKGQIEDLTETVNKYKGKLGRREEQISEITKERDELAKVLSDTKKKYEMLTQKYRQVGEELGRANALIDQLDPKNKYH